MRLDPPLLTDVEAALREEILRQEREEAFAQWWNADRIEARTRLSRGLARVVLALRGGGE